MTRQRKSPHEIVTVQIRAPRLTPAARFVLGEMAELTIRGHRVRFDEADAELVAAHKWYVILAGVKSGQASYCFTYVQDGPGRSNATRRRVPMHRLLLATEAEVDHVNGDGLDNRRANLRPATRAQNAKNLPARKGCASPFKGVTIKRRKGGLRFSAQIKQDGECLKIGTFDSEHRAARAYDGAARLFHGPFARTNKDMGLYELHPDRGAEDVHLA